MTGSSAGTHALCATMTETSMEAQQSAQVSSIWLTNGERRTDYLNIAAAQL